MIGYQTKVIVENSPEESLLSYDQKGKTSKVSGGNYQTVLYKANTNEDSAHEPSNATMIEHGGNASMSNDQTDAKS